MQRRPRADRRNLCYGCAALRVAQNAVELHERAQRGDVEEYRALGRIGGLSAYGGAK